MDSQSKILASNDKTLELVNIRMESLSNAIKNQVGFNKMLESQLQQLTLLLPMTKVRL
jgi:hypothetical protein